MKIILSLIFVILLVTGCKEQNKKKTTSTKAASTEVIIGKTSVDELYIGKEFYSGDELNTYTFITSNKIKENDSLAYSIYKKNDRDSYLFSIEKLVSNQDKEKFIIIDLFKFTNYETANNKVEVLDKKNGYSVLFKDRNEILKKWMFQLHHSNINKIWNGKYDCRFLRIKEESADPRAYAIVVVNIENDKATFRLDSYNEQLSKDFLIINSSVNKIDLYEKGDKSSKFSITKSNNEFILTSDLLNKITGEVKNYKLKKM